MEDEMNGANVSRLAREIAELQADADAAWNAACAWARGALAVNARDAEIAEVSRKQQARADKLWEELVGLVGLAEAEVRVAHYQR